MDSLEKIIRARHSVRSYLDKEIEEEKVNELNELISEINKSQNLNIQLILDDNEVFDRFILHYGRLKNCKNYIALIGKQDNRLEEKIGYFGEKIVLKAQGLGLNTCWVAGTYKKSLVKANINIGEKLVCIIALGYGETNGTSSIDYPEWFQRGIEFALLAPTALNEQKFRFEYLGGDNIKAIRGNGSMTKIDLGIVKYHFEIGANRKINWN